ncbi:hypothetical protein N7539_005280 [Penicillium diatomitis]|uniref:Gfo/Idh/MocA-like oxidoreductase N-terminal domain-containing protein n=1 Tax=Penicillium diatomitis TaxID=2819901 RepID=A0A9W9X6Q3_9EURO|nr:uncharacterized protein N7539_005280 [Penicillium diatomitis]KAJ5485292.1 hypothetical protein N7539_005280 [Penicillium diatomitis]
MATTVLKVGILGLTPATEPIYVGILSSLSQHYALTIVHADTKELALSIQQGSSSPRVTAIPEEVIQNSEVNLIINLFPFRQHEPYTIAALQAGKHVMVKTPLSLSPSTLSQIRAALGDDHKSSDTSSHSALSSDCSRPQFFISCARRYAPCFTEVFKRELASLEIIHYVRCRNITGFASTPDVSNINPRSLGATTTTKPEASDEGTINHATDTIDINIPSRPKPSSSSSSSIPLSHRHLPKHMHAVLADIFGPKVEATADREALCHFIGTSGSHDFSLIQESFGFPDAVSHVSIIKPFYNAMFHYKDGSVSSSRGASQPFTLFYEAGVDGVPRSDAHLTVYGLNKTISFSYQLSHPSEMNRSSIVARVVVETVDHGTDADGDTDVNMGNGISDANGNRPVPEQLRLKRTEYVNTANEVYEQEFLAMHAQLTGAATSDLKDLKVRPKTSLNDATDDLKIMHMIFDHYDRQCGTIRTPLG